MDCSIRKDNHPDFQEVAMEVLLALLDWALILLVAVLLLTQVEA